ncbi:MAG: hypothetical protein WDM78_01485 [Puia sp.]
MDPVPKTGILELEMEKSNSPEMQEVFLTQKQEANTEFFKFISKITPNGLQQKIRKRPL